MLDRPAQPAGLLGAGRTGAVRRARRDLPRPDRSGPGARRGTAHRRARVLGLGQPRPDRGRARRRRLDLRSGCAASGDGRPASARPPMPRRPFARRFAVAWLRLAAVVAVGFVIQENVEHSIIHGHAPGVGALLGPEYPLALPVIGLIGAIAASVAALVARRAGSARPRHRGGSAPADPSAPSLVRDRPRGSPPPSVRSSPIRVPAALLRPWSSQASERTQSRVARSVATQEES